MISRKQQTPAAANGMDQPKGFGGTLMICLIMSNLVLLYFPVLALRPGFPVRSLDLSMLFGGAFLFASGTAVFKFSGAKPQSTFLLGLLLSACLSTAICLFTTTVSTEEFERVIRALIRLIEVIFLAYIMRTQVRPNLFPKVLLFILIVCAALPLSSIYLSITNPGTFTRIGGFVTVGTAEGGIEAEQSNFNELGALCATLIVLCVSVWMQRRTSLRGLRLVAVPFAMLYTVGLVLTNSRSGFAGALAGVMTLLWLGNARHRMLIVVIAGLMLSVASLNEFMPDSPVGRVFRTFEADSPEQMSALARLDGIESAWEVFLSSPVVGVGYACFRMFNDRNMITPESYFMEILADLGIVGALLWALYLQSVFKQAYQLMRKTGGNVKNLNAPLTFIPAIVCLLVTCLTGNNFFDPGLLLLFFFLCAFHEVVYRSTFAASPVKAWSQKRSYRPGSFNQWRPLTAPELKES